MPSLKKAVEDFKERTGRDIMEEVTKVPEPVPIMIDPEVWELARQKILSLLREFEEFYALKGRGIEVTVRIKKDNYGNLHKEVFDYSDKIKLEFVAEIGTDI